MKSNLLPLIVAWISRILLAAVFLASAYLKLFPIEPFELTLVDSGLVGWGLAPFVARLLIGLEFFLGAAILVNTRYYPLVLRSMAGLTVLFTLYLVLFWMARGNDTNCGCFGNHLVFTPLESILKNGIILGLLYVLIRLESKFKRSWKWVQLLVLLNVLSLPFILNPISFSNNRPDQTEYPSEFPLQFMPEEVRLATPFDLNEGEYLIAFFSTTCGHCKTSAQMLQIAQHQLDLPPIHVYFFGPESKIPEFMQVANADFPFTLFQNQFVHKFTGGTYPTLLLVKDGQIFKRWTGNQITIEELRKSRGYLSK